jgi:DNA-binding CsgD family transcriptional regulator
LRLCRDLSKKAIAAEKGIAAENLDGLACVAEIFEEDERAARMFGAARTLHETVGSLPTPAERALREPYLTNVRSRLDEAAWEAAFAEGRAMTFEEAVEYALEYALLADKPSFVHRVPASPSIDDLAILTRREREVAALVSRGLTNRQIASELVISGYTVNNHVAKILRKLGLSSRTQISTLVVEDRPYAPPRD